MTLPLKDWLIGGAVVAVIAGGIIGVREIEHRGAVKVLTQQVRDSAKVVTDSLAKDTRRALQAEQDRQAALTLANNQVAAGKRLQDRTDSAAKDAGTMRDAANRVLVDSLATLDALHTALFNLVAASRADSAAAVQQRVHDGQTIAGLLFALEADSTAFAAERKRAADLQALSDLHARESALLRQQQPSFVANHTAVGVGYGCGAFGGKVACGPVVAAMVRVWP